MKTAQSEDKIDTSLSHMTGLNNSSTMLSHFLSMISNNGQHFRKGSSGVGGKCMHRERDRETEREREKKEGGIWTKPVYGATTHLVDMITYNVEKQVQNQSATH